MERLDIKKVQIQGVLEEATRSGKVLVGQVMTPAPSCIRPDTTVLDLVRKFHQKEFRHLLVTDEQDRLKGVISDRDVIRCFGPGRYPRPEVLARIPAERVMSTDLIHVSPDTLLDRAVWLMLTHGISCLPVLVDEKLVGIVTNTDVQIMLHEMLQSLRAIQATESAREEYPAESFSG